MNEKITDLEQLRIHELRDLARKMGVNAPTSKKKEQLIDEIMKIMNGESAPVSNKTKKGRPVRTSSENFDVVDFILPSQDELKLFNEYTDYQLEQEKYHFMLNMDFAEYKDVDLGESIKEGCVEIKSEGFGIIHVKGLLSDNDDVYVNKITIKQLKLRSGDYVRAKCKKVKDNYPLVAYEIVKISEHSDKNYDDMPAKPLSEELHISAPDLTKFKLGGRYFVHPSDDSYEVTANIALEIMKKYPSIVVETLYLNSMMERLPYNEKLVVNHIPFSRQDEDVITGTNLYFERIKRIAETGKHVVVVVNEITQFSKSYNNIYLKSSSYNEISNVTTHRTKALLSIAKNVGDASITIIAVDKLRVPLNIENLFKFEILPLFNN